LVQRASDDYESGTWCFPGGKRDPCDIDSLATAKRELSKEVGVEGKIFDKLCNVSLDKHYIQVFLCHEWTGVLKPSDKDIIGIGWFTLPEMYKQNDTISSFAISALPYIAYRMRHYYKNKEGGDGGVS
jgi:8-oxo-dGTP pyrophosphatase MutT (NUDIX family)